MTPLPIRLAALLLFASPVYAADVTVRLDAGSGFAVRNNTGAVERLRVDEATGNVSRNGLLFVHTTGPNGTFVGANAGSLFSTGEGNSAFGAYALDTNTTGVLNTALGVSALRSNTEGYANTAVGAGSLYFTSIGFFNAAVGDDALRSNTSGNSNTAVGALALRSNTTGTGNVAAGYVALAHNVGGYFNTASGTTALYGNTEGDANTGTGFGALRANTTGSSNTAFGYGALYGNTTGNQNVAIGAGAGSVHSTGSDNVYLANPGAAAESGQIRIGTAGTHTNTHIAGIHGATSAGGIAVLVNASGTLGTTTSSARFKKNVRDMDRASDVVMRLRPVAFEYREEAVGPEESKTTQYGLIAEEVAEVAPELVAPDADGRPYSVKYHELPALLLNELQEQERTIAEQRALIAALADRVARLEAR